MVEQRSLPRTGGNFLLHAIIFANGELNYPQAAREAAAQANLVVAADGGTHHCLSLGIIPNILIGDLDSVRTEELHILEKSGTEIIRFPSRKDFTDLELAIQEISSRNFREIYILGALGARWDHTLANVLLPATQAYANLRISLVDGPQEILLLRGSGVLEIKGDTGDIVSLIPLGGDASGITTEGLEYTLQEEALIFGATRGISNVLTSKRATVHLREGILLCIVLHTEKGAEAL